MTAGVLLAAGASRRMGGASKLLLPFRGKALVRWAGEAVRAAGLRPLVAVLGRDARAVREALGGLGFSFVENARYEEGMATSIVEGIAALGAACERAALALGDMPLVSPESIRRTVAGLEESGKGIAVPVRAGRRGHPVAFDLRAYRAELLALSGDEGARSLLSRHPGDVLEVALDDPGILLDVDTAEEYEKLNAKG